MSADTPDVLTDWDELADWLGAQVESHNVTDPSDEQTTWIEIPVEVLAERIIRSDWLAARVAAERERADTAEAVLREVLSQFTEKGHPGRACLRTGWIYVETVARWRAALGGEATP